jgi:hypothetical protein
MNDIVDASRAFPVARNNQPRETVLPERSNLPVGPLSICNDCSGCDAEVRIQLASREDRLIAIRPGDGDIFAEKIIFDGGTYLNAGKI